MDDSFLYIEINLRYKNYEKVFQKLSHYLAVDFVHIERGIYRKELGDPNLGV